MNKEMIKHELRPQAWNPFQEFRKLAGMSELFDDVFGTFPALRTPAFARSWEPKVNIEDDGKHYIISAALPGVKKEDVKIRMESGALILSAECKEEKEEKGKNWLKRELGYGSFQRSFILPADVHPEEIKAAYKDGILTMTVPKVEPEKSRGVSIKVD